MVNGYVRHIDACHSMTRADDLCHICFDDTEHSNHAEQPMPFKYS